MAELLTKIPLKLKSTSSKIDDGWRTFSLLVYYPSDPEHQMKNTPLIRIINSQIEFDDGDESYNLDAHIQAKTVEDIYQWLKLGGEYYFVSSLNEYDQDDHLILELIDQPYYGLESIV